MAPYPMPHAGFKAVVPLALLGDRCNHPAQLKEVKAEAYSEDKTAPSTSDAPNQMY